MEIETLKMLAAQWSSTDPDPSMRAVVQGWLDADDLGALRASFGQRLQFGTAGLRGRVGPGPSCMNRKLVRQVSAGLGAYLLGAVDDAADRGVVVGYDGRLHSRIFAEDTARVLAARGIRVWLAESVTTTPYLAFATVDLAAAAGVMVTASHNPPQDNGYKVYWSNGAQIVPPHDAGISAAIDAVDEVVEPLPLDELPIEPIPATVRERYLQRVMDLRVHDANGLRVVYTAMHGVGKQDIVEVLHRAGHTDLHLVAEQVEPDGHFPTVSFPNPEEPGALDLAMDLATKVDADLIIANDPDADRLAVAIPEAGEWRQLTGNQVGVLLAADQIANCPGEPDQRRMVSTTIVSTGMLRRIAEAQDVDYVETLTGFKWIANAAIVVDGRGDRFLLGFEEALGYSAGSVVRDKDGVSAALLLVDLAASLKAEGKTLRDGINALYRTYGVYVTRQNAIKLPGEEGAQRIRAALAGLREDPPTTLGGVQVVRVRDLLTGVATSTDGSTEAIDLPRSNVLAFDLADGGSVLARPSGTEPKIKFYGEVRQDVGEGTVAEAEAEATTRVAALVDEITARAGLA